MAYKQYFLVLFVLHFRCASVVANDAVNACNQTITNGMIRIVTPEAGRRTSGQPLLCTYTFQASEGQNMFWRIIFHRFSISSSKEKCKDGYVQIIDGNNWKNSSLGHICGTFERKHEYISESDKVVVTFYSNNYRKQQFLEFVAKDEPKWNLHQRFGQYPQLNPNRRGEHVAGTYCDRFYSEGECSNGWCHVQSPGFPGFYLPNLSCNYLIQVRDTYATLTISSIDVDSMQCDNVECFPKILSWDNDCKRDYIRVYDGPTTSHPIITTLCGRAKSKQKIVASNNQMLLQFITSKIGSLTNYGFEFRADGTSKKSDEGVPPTDRETSCNASHSLKNTNRVYFSSTKHWYPKNTTCSYRVSGLAHEVLTVNFYVFQAGKESFYCNNYLMFYEGLQADPSKVIVQLCDMNPPRSTLLTNGPDILIVFHSEEGSLDGSALNYAFDVRSHDALQFGNSFPGTVCDESFLIPTDGSGNFSSPRNFLRFQSIEKPVRCQYHFEASSRQFQRVSVVFKGMFQEQNKDCSLCYGLGTGYIKAYEGSSKNGKMIGCICGISETRPRTYKIVSDGPEITLVYTFTPRLIKQFPSHFGRAQVMFEGYYELFHGPRCGPIVYPATLDGFLEYPSSKTFQGLYFQKTVCIWKIERETNKDFFVKIMDLFLQGNCQTDYLEIRSAKSPEDFSIRLCGNSSGSIYQRVILRQEVRDSAVEIEMMSSSQGNTFNVTWTQVDYHETLSDPQALVHEDDCAFQCIDRDSILCLDQSLVCNGISNCPEMSHVEFGRRHDEIGCSEVSSQTSGFFGVGWHNWLAIGLGCGLAICLFIVTALLYHKHCKSRKMTPVKSPYDHNQHCSTFSIS